MRMLEIAPVTAMTVEQCTFAFKPPLKTSITGVDVGLPTIRLALCIADKSIAPALPTPILLWLSRPSSCISICKLAAVTVNNGLDD